MSGNVSVPETDLSRQAAASNNHSPPRVTLRAGDCRELLPAMKARSVHLVVTDPPYFLHGLDAGWRKGTGGPRGTGAVGSLPVGMKFDPGQGRRLQEFLAPIACELLRLLKPGGFLLMFAAPRLYHRAAVAVEDAGFEIRDAYAWRFTRRAQFKAFSMEHFVKRRKDLSEDEKSALIQRLAGRKTPQLRPQFEPILCAQKPREGAFVDNWIAHGTGLIDARQSLTDRVPENRHDGGETGQAAHRRPSDAQANGALRASDPGVLRRGPDSARSLCRQRNYLSGSRTRRTRKHRHGRQPGLYRDGAKAMPLTPPLKPSSCPRL